MKHIKFLVIIIIAFIGKQNSCFSQYNVGDTLKFWSVTYIDWPPLQSSPQRLVNAICKKAGNHCYVFVEDSATQPLQANVDSLVHTFDYHFYDSLTTRYGPVPNVFDNDSNIFILSNGDLEANYPRKYQNDDSKSLNALRAAGLIREADYQSNSMANLKEVISNL